MKNIQTLFFCCILHLFLIIPFSSTYSQTIATREITGVVKDRLGEPLIGVAIAVLGTDKGVITGIDGEFSLSILNNEPCRLRISYLGFVTLEIEVESKKDHYDIILEESSSILEEVVVTAMAPRKAQYITAAAGTTSSNSLIVSTSSDKSLDKSSEKKM